MPVSEPIGEEKRVALMNRLIEVLGEEEARTLMESLPPVLWTHLATKDDLHALEKRLRTDMDGKFAALTAEVRGGFAKIEAQFKEVHAEFKDVHAEFKSVRAENTDSKGEIALMLAKQTRTVAFMLVGFALSIWISLLVVGLS